MAKSSIHIEAGGGGYFAHNSREQSTVNSIFSDEQNFCSCSKEEAFKTYRSELEKRTEAYKENHNRTKLHAKTITHLSAIVNFNKEHTPEDMKRVCELLERKFDTKVIQFAMHRDEGHIKEDGTPDKNYHAHIEFMGLDSRGESVRRKLDRPTLRELQSDVSKLLKMERGHEYAKEGLSRPKRLDTYPFKHHKQELEKAVKEAVLATQKDLNAEMAVLRSQFKEQGATRADYAQLEQLNKELKEQVKAKELSEDELHRRIKSLHEWRAEDKKNILELSQTVETLKTDILEISTKYSNSEKTIEALQSELQEAKRPSAAVEIPQGDIEQLEEVKKLRQFTLAIPNTDERNALAQKLRKDNAIDEIAKTCYKKVEEKGVFTTTTKTVFDNKAFYQKVKERENEHQKLHSFNDTIIITLGEKLKTVVEMTKTALEAIKSKFMSKSLSEPKKERTELNLSNTDKIRGFIDQIKGNEPTKGNDLQR